MRAAAPIMTAPKVASDTKKVQSLINHVGQRVQLMRDEMDVIKAVRDRYVAQGVSPVGTPLEGHVAALAAALTALSTALQAATFDALIAAVVPTHRGTALDEE